MIIDQIMAGLSREDRGVLAWTVSGKQYMAQNGMVAVPVFKLEAHFGERFSLCEAAQSCV